MEAVSKWGLLLQHASEELRGDLEVVMKAASEDHEALLYATEELRNSNEFVKVVRCKCGLQVTLLSGRQTNVFFDDLDQHMSQVLYKVARALDMDDQTVIRSVGCCFAPPSRR